MTRAELAGLIGFFFVGAIAGAVYLGALEWNVRVYCGSSVAKLGLGLHAARLLGIAAMLSVIARSAGSAALLAAVGGFEAARILMVSSMSLRVGKIQ